MLVLELLSFPDIAKKALSPFLSRLFVTLLVSERILSTHVDIARSTRKVYSVPHLQRYSWRRSVDVLHRDVLVRPIVDVRASLKLTKEIYELPVVELAIKRFIVVNC